MTTIMDYLASHEKNVIPSWLKEYNKNKAFDAHKFFSEKTVFYPGSGTDGHPVRLFAGSHAAHSFVYADYGLPSERIVEELNHPIRGFRGYKVFNTLKLNERDVNPNGWIPSLDREELKRFSERSQAFASENFGLFVVLEREETLDDMHGPERIAILFLGADGIATFDAIYCQPQSLKPPFAIIIQDHGFGGNYDKFGSGNLLEKIAQRRSIFPEYILTDNSRKLWHGYHCLDLELSVGGMHSNERGLYKKCRD